MSDNSYNLTKLSDLHREYIATKAMLIEQNKAANEIINATRARLDAERERDATRLQELSKVINDKTQRETTRALAAAEKKDLETKVYTASAAEKICLLRQSKPKQQPKKIDCQSERILRMLMIR